MARELNRLNPLKIKHLKAGIYHDGGGLYIRVQSGGSKQWTFRYTTNGKARDMGLGSARFVSLAEAREKASRNRKLIRQGEDPIEHRNREPGRNIEQRICEKAKYFLAQEIVPACYLYRHYDPNSDLIYVGLSVHPLRRQSQHLQDANWRAMISRILIEPFISREEAIAAEYVAIREEFPKFNRSHNDRPNPALELAKRDRTGNKFESQDSSIYPHEVGAG